jgi:hypothetical protein
MRIGVHIHVSVADGIETPVEVMLAFAAGLVTRAP